MPPIHKTDICIVKINGKDFVAGLMWQPLSRPRAYMKEAREIGKRDDMDIVAIRPGSNLIQAGFVQKGNGVTKGMYSLASALAGQIKQESWIGAFQLPNDQYALVAVHSGLIVPGCDIIGEKLEVLNLLKEKDSQPKVMKFDMVYHPDDFDYRGESLDIENLLIPSVVRKEYALKPLNFGLTRHEIMVVGCAAAAVIVLAIGYMQWSAYQEREAAREAARQEQIRLEQVAALSAESGSEQTIQALEHPWASMPSVEDFLNGCQGAIDSLPLAVGGWTFESALCNPATIESVFQRTGKTTFNDFIAATQGKFPSPPVLMEGADRAGLGDAIKLGPDGDEELLTMDVLQADFTSHLQKFDLKADIVEVPVAAPVAPAALPGEPEAPQPPAPDWRQFSFSLSSQYPPKYIFSGLNLQGVRLTEITVIRSETQLDWSLKGEIYAR